jgi:CheY-like chemotaxis protein
MMKRATWTRSRAYSRQAAARSSGHKGADEALLATLTNDFAAIILDIKMPGMDGLELARLIKQRKRS